MRVGLLGLQGAFLDHIPHLQRCGVSHRIVADAAQLGKVDRLIIPGGESTVMLKFLKEFGMLSVLRERIAGGMPAWGVCAGAIVLAQTIDDTPGPVAALPLAVTRNAYGRQLQSRRQAIDIPLFDAADYPGIFIRSPRIDRVAHNVTTHATCNGDPVFVQHHRVMATTFHPELNRLDDRFHSYFLTL